MVLSISNQKGGSGKSTTSWAIVSGATFRGKKALAIDLDSQCNLSYIMGADMSKPGSYELLTGDKRRLVQHTDQGDIIPGTSKLTTADVTLQDRSRVYALRDAIKPFLGSYDVIVIDTPPTLGTLLINALSAADGVVIPLRAKIVNLQGLIQLVQTIGNIQREYNADLDCLGALITEYNGRTNAARVMADQIKKTAAEYNVPVFKTTIRQGVAVDEAQIMKQSLFTYAPRANVTKDYAAFLDELGI